MYVYMIMYMLLYGLLGRRMVYIGFHTENTLQLSWQLNMPYKS